MYGFRYDEEAPPLKDTIITLIIYFMILFLFGYVFHYLQVEKSNDGCVGEEGIHSLNRQAVFECRRKLRQKNN